jgi:hypothetical protein
LTDSRNNDGTALQVVGSGVDTEPIARLDFPCAQVRFARRPQSFVLTQKGDLRNGDVDIPEQMASRATPFVRVY